MLCLFYILVFPMIRTSILLIILSVFLVGCTVQPDSGGTNSSSSSSSDNAGEPQILSQGNVTATVTYQGNSLWGYIVSVDLPNPCYDVTVTPIIAESFPEQVNLKVEQKSTQTEGTVCTQQIQTVQRTGSYSADAAATIRLQVN